MKRTKMSRRIAIALSAVMVIGGISVNTYAENLDSEIEIMMEGEVITDIDEVSVADDDLFVDDELLIDDSVAEPVISDDDVVVDEGEIIIADVEEIIVDAAVETEPATEIETETELETEGFEIVDDELTIEVEDEVDTAEVETLLSADAQADVAQTTITLNYESYSLKAVGETVLLVATVSEPETEVSSEAAETSSDDLVVIDEEADSVVDSEIVSDTADVDNTDDGLANDTVVDDAVDAVTFEVVSEVESNVSWTSSDESVVTVSEVGIVTAVASGEAVVTCTLDSDPNVTATCVITVSAGCALQEHVHSREECFVRELICSHVSEEEHTADCYLNKFVCGMEEHVHDETCFEDVAETENLDGVV